jgi:purine catabolism regulator
MISVEELLKAPVMRGSRLLAGQEVAAQRAFSWTSVIEWQAVRFVNPDELVCTTAIGLDEEMLTTFIQELLRSPAVAICVSLHPTGAASRIPDAPLEEADNRGTPVLDVPWEIAFADINRWAVDELLRRRKASTVDEPTPNAFPSFTDVLLDGGNANDVAAMLESCLTRPVLVFNAALVLTGHGPMAEREMNPDAITNLRMRTAKLSPRDAGALADRLVKTQHHRYAGEPRLGLPPGMVVPAAARRRLMGFVYVPDDRGLIEGPNPSDVELAAIREAANVIAIDGMRTRLATPADKLDREDFLWDVVHGKAGPPDHLIRRATELGLDPRTRFSLAVARTDSSNSARRDSGPSLDALADDLRERFTRRAVEVILSVRDDLLLLLAPGLESGTHSLREALEQASAERTPGVRTRWGLATGARGLSELAASFRDAQAALRIGDTLGNGGTVADAAELEPFILLYGIARDPQAAALARGVVEPVVEYDRKTGRNLLETIEAYLAAGGNASSTSRRLNLNRHSMLYRLNKFEELTNRDLGDAADRFVVDLSIKLFRLGALSAGTTEAA